LHKVSTEIVKKYDTIFLEDLNVKGMVKNHKLAKHISDAAWSKFVDMISYKAIWNNKQVVKIDRFYPSSKTCHKCHYINQSLTLDKRTWICPECNQKHDRDVNAAINILLEGLKIISSGTDDYKRGAKIRPTKVGASYETCKIQT
jgi:putative transposase